MKLLQLIIAFLIFPVLLSNSAKHDYYVSVTKIEYAKEEQSLQIISQIFINDFEKLLRQRYDESITLNEEDEPEAIEKYMQRYLSDKLKINVNGASVGFKFIGKEYNDDITYCYLEIENISEIKSLEVINRTLFDILPEQQNIVRLKLLGRNKSFLLLPDNDKCMLNFN
ncbi:DUF6702 family protein [Winogradskyella sp.]|uniref:DUF6702 family protein n=1 Tax=Winogradskyella sp. TaxID=1883156 RepID=UPI0025D07EE1|nr:DUF6702 family protein [Winogradskyella sp.]